MSKILIASFAVFVVLGVAVAVTGQGPDVIEGFMNCKFTNDCW